jgi:uncharacterized repeat protein (TIGR01451 family)
MNTIKLLILGTLFFPILVKAQLSISEAPISTTVTYQNNVTYSGSVTATGTISNVHVRKTLPAGLKFVSGSPNATLVGGAVNCGGEVVDINFGNLSGGLSGQIFSYSIVAKATCPAYPNIITYQSTPSIVSGTGQASSPFTAVDVTQSIADPLSWITLSKSMQTALPIYNGYMHAFYNQSLMFKISVGTNINFCPPTCCNNVMPTLTNIKLVDNFPPSAILDGPILDGSNNPLPPFSYTFLSGVLTINSLINYTICSSSKDFYVKIKIPCQTTPTSLPIPNTLLTNTVNLSFNSSTTYNNYKTAEAKFIIEEQEAKAQLVKEVKIASGNSCPNLYYYNLSVIDTGTVKLDGYTISDTFPSNITVTKIVTPVSTSCSYTVKYKLVNMNNTFPDPTYTTYSGSPVTPATTLLIPGAITPPGGKKIFAIQIISAGTGCTILPPDNISPYLHQESTQIYYTINPNTSSGATIINTASGIARAFDNTVVLFSCPYPNINTEVNLSSSASQTYDLADFELVKSICNPKTCYNIGDTVIFDFALRNNGSGGTLSSVNQIEDNLSYYGLNFVSTLDTYVSHSQTPSNCTNVGPVSTNISSVTTTSTLSGGYITWGLPSGLLMGACPIKNDSVIHIRFSAKILPMSSGTHWNNGAFQFKLSSYKFTNSVPFEVCDKDSLIYTKELSTDGGLTWNNTGTVLGGSTIQYKLKLKNYGTHFYPLSTTNPLIFSDVFPNSSTNEGTISTKCGSRGSDINLILPTYSTTNYEAKLNITTNLTPNYKFFDIYTADLTSNYGNGYSLCNTTVATPQNNTSSGFDKAFLFSSLTPAIINPGDEIVIKIKNIMVPNVPSGTSRTACNSFTLKVGTSAVAESNNVCLTINSSSPPCNLVAVAGPDKTLCTGLTTNIGTPSINGNTYSWSSNPAGYTSLVANPPVSPTVTTTYYLTVTNTNTQCIAKDTVLVTVNNCQPINCIPSTTTISNTSKVSLINNNTTGISQLLQSFSFSGLPTNIKEVRAVLTNIKIFAENENGIKTEECLSCLNDPIAWGSIVNGSTITTTTKKININGVETIATGTILKNQNPKQITWVNGGNVFAVSTPIELSFLLPKKSTLPCCTRKATICVKFIFRNDKCEECIVKKCFDVEIK